MATAAQESKAEPVGTALSLAELARKTLHACKYPKQTGQFLKDVGRGAKPKQATALKQLWSCRGWTLCNCLGLS